MLSIRLIGQPAIFRDGATVKAPRGKKAWAVLAFLLLADRPYQRQQLAEIFFAEADDPLGALRWTLAELRRALGLSDLFTGDPVVFDRPDDLRVDARTLVANSADTDPGALALAAGELLEGLVLPACLEFESWLSVMRHRISAEIEARLRQAAVASLAVGEFSNAIICAQNAVTRNPLDEGNHELLIRALALAGDFDQAKRQTEVCEQLLRKELGVEPSAALREAAFAGRHTRDVLTTSAKATASSQLQAGRAAIAAGAVDAGLGCLHLSVAQAAKAGEPKIQAKALVALGGALVHGVRGRDCEGTVVLHEAIGIASAVSDHGSISTAYRELGYVEVYAGRRQTAEMWLRKAFEAADSDNELAAIHGVMGLNAADQGDHLTAFGHFDESVRHAERGANGRQKAWSMAMRARSHITRGELDDADKLLRNSLDIANASHWIAFLPWPQSLKAEIDLHDGYAQEAEEALEQAWALASQLGDPCWESASARVLGMLAAQRGDTENATRWLREALWRCSRTPDCYQWIRAQVLETVARHEFALGEVDRARQLTGTLGTLAARCGMREFTVRAHLLQHYIDGDDVSLAAARHLVQAINNPLLTASCGAIV